VERVGPQVSLSPPGQNSGISNSSIVSCRTANLIFFQRWVVGSASLLSATAMFWRSGIFCPSLAQQWTCIVVTGTNVRGPSAYVRRSDHTVTEVSQSDAPQRSSHHTNFQLRTGLNPCRLAGADTEARSALRGVPRFSRWKHCAAAPTQRLSPTRS